LYCTTNYDYIAIFLHLAHNATETVSGRGQPCQKFNSNVIDGRK
jgi:hypothetical protein